MKRNIFLVVGIILFVFSSCSSEHKVKSHVVDVKQELPVYLGNGMTLVDIGIEDRTLVWMVEADEFPIGMLLETLNDPRINKTVKNSVLDYLDLSECDGLKDLLEDMVDAKYSLSIRLFCESLDSSTEIVFKPHELRHLCAE